MKYVKLSFIILSIALASACGGVANNANLANHTNTANSDSNTAPTAQTLTVVERPQKIKDMMAARGEQDEAKPTLKIIEPKANAAIASSIVKVKLQISGDLKGYKPHIDPETKMGNHIHVILDNQPYEAYYNLDEEFELRNVVDGEHTLRVFPSRPWHESYKDEGAFQMVKFTVKNGAADSTKPATTNSGQQMSNPPKSFNAPPPPGNSEPVATAPPPPTPEGKDMQPSTAGAVDAKKPLLTYSRPKGEYKGADADAIMIDFWLANAQLKEDGGPYRVRYSVDGGEAKYIDKWAPIWLSGWSAGKHSIKLELVDQEGAVIDNGGYNSTTREITVTK